ncbi:MAG: hypothetical protein AAF594_18225 [Bacteroidota bacterium]
MSDTTVSVPTPLGDIAITAPVDRSRRVRKRQDAHRQFIAGHWSSLAAAAFEGYRRHGAGAVVLWRDTEAARFRPRPFEPERLFYTTQIHALPGTTEADFDGWEARQLETYDPHSSALVVIVEGKDLAGYHASGPPRPPDALRGSQATLN